MKKYVKPILDIEDIEVTDIILTSTNESFNPFFPDESDGSIVIPQAK